MKSNLKQFVYEQVNAYCWPNLGALVTALQENGFVIDDVNDTRVHAKMYGNDDPNEVTDDLGLRFGVVGGWIVINTVNDMSNDDDFDCDL